jgi:hypothetical protein
MADSGFKLAVNKLPIPLPKLMRTLLTLTLATLFSLSAWLFAPAALAITQIPLSDVNYRDCPPELAKGAVTSGATEAAACFEIYGKTQNTSGKAVYDADVYGRIYDADNNNVLPNRGRVGTIDKVEVGTSDFAIHVTIPATLKTPLTLKKFKASGFTTKIRQ